MLALLEKYSLTEIITFIIILCLAVKGAVTFYDWAHERLNRKFHKETDAEQTRKNVQIQIKEIKDHMTNLDKTIKLLSQKINLLVASDKDDIKSFITKEHHYFCYNQEWIDDHSLDCIERRYEHYIAEGGNSYIKDLMSEIRQLPKQSPIQQQQPQAEER